MEQAYLQIENVVQRYGPKTVLDIAGLAVGRGEVIAVIGANGAGKSTLLRLIAHLERPVAGSIKLDGKIRDGLDARRRLAMVFQEPLLFSSTVFENIAYGLRVRKLSQEEVADKVHTVAGMLGISHLLDRASSTLSGGEAQRVSLARALVIEPELLLLDEPMASLDPPTKESLLADLQRILDELHITVLYVTHQRTEAIQLADRLVVMDEGKVVQAGTPREVVTCPATQRVAELVGVETILQGDVTAASNGVATVTVNGSEIKAARRQDIAGRVWVFIRSENVTIATGDVSRNGDDRNCLPGIVEKMLDTGAFYRVAIDCGFPLVSLLTRRSVEEMDLRVGRRVWASFKPAGVHVVPREGERVHV